MHLWLLLGRINNSQGKVNNCLTKYCEEQFNRAPPDTEYVHTVCNLYIQFRTQCEFYCLIFLDKLKTSSISCFNVTV